MASYRYEDQGQNLHQHRSTNSNVSSSPYSQSHYSRHPQSAGSTSSIVATDSRPRNNSIIAASVEGRSRKNSVIATPAESRPRTNSFYDITPAGLNLRRQPTSGSGREEEQRIRSSEGTIKTMMSTSTTGRESAGTHMTEAPAYSKKIVVVGDGGCGKTCLLISYSQGYFPEKYVPTVFENYITYPTHPPTGKTVELALWDTAGQEEYDRLRPLSYPETDLIFVCFAIDCPNSLENVVDKWYPEVLHFCPYTPLFLVGLKSDLRYKKTCIDMLKTQGLTPVTSEQGLAVARKMNAQYMECSSKEMRGVDEIFEQAILTVVENDRRMLEHQGTSGSAAGGERPTGFRKRVLKRKQACKTL